MTDGIKRFFKENIYIIIGAICFMAIGIIYLVQVNNPKTVIKANTENNMVTIYSSEAEKETAVENENKIIKAYIAGAVRNPGVYEIAEGARVDDLLELAGGHTEEADLLRVNLAAYVNDAQRVIIPSVNNEMDYVFEDGEAETGERDKPGSLININTAAADQLTTLPNIGPSRARSIIEYRESNGGFKAIDDIKKISGIGDAIFNSIKDRITVDK